MLRQDLQHENSLHHTRFHEMVFNFYHNYVDLKYLGTNLPANEKDHVCMRITFYCLITNTKKFFLLMDKRGNSISFLYPPRYIIAQAVLCFIAIKHIYLLPPNVKMPSSRPYQIPLFFILATTKYFH